MIPFIALVAPMVLWVLWRSTVRTIYNGPALALGSSVLIAPKRGDAPQFAFVSIDVPELGLLVAEVSLERAKSISGSAWFPVEVVVCRGLLTRPYVDSIQWQGGGAVDRPSADGAALLVSLAYFVLGCIGLAQSMATETLVAFISSGFVSGWSQLKHKQINSGLAVILILLGALFGLAGIACFQQVNILTLFPGVVLAFAFGQVGGMLAAAWR